MADGDLQKAEACYQGKEGKPGKINGHMLIESGAFGVSKMPEHHTAGHQPEQGGRDHENGIPGETAGCGVIQRQETGDTDREETQDVPIPVKKRQVRFSLSAGKNRDPDGFGNDFRRSDVHDSGLR